MPPKLQAQIRASHAVVALLTKVGARSSYVQEDVGFAIGEGKPVVPLVEHGVGPKHLGMLDGVEHIPFKRGDLESVRAAQRPDDKRRFAIRVSCGRSSSFLDDPSPEWTGGHVER